MPDATELDPADPLAREGRWYVDLDGKQWSHEEAEAEWSDEQWARYFLADRESALATLNEGRYPVHEAWKDKPDEMVRVMRANLTKEAHEFRREIAEAEARRSGYVETSCQPAPVRSVNRQHQGRAPRRATNSRSAGSRRSVSRSSSRGGDSGDDGSGEPPPALAGRPLLLVADPTWGRANPAMLRTLRRLSL